MATISPENRTRSVADSDPEPAEETKELTDDAAAASEGLASFNGHKSLSEGARGEPADNDAVERGLIPTEEVDNIIVKLHKLQKKIGYLDYRRRWLLNNEHQPAAEATKHRHRLRIEYTNTEGVTRIPIRKAQIFHNEFQPLQDYLFLVETDQKENRVRIESLLEAATQQTENEGETPDSRPNGGRSLAEIASELDEAQQTGEWYAAEKKSANDRLDDINREIREQPEIAEPLQKCEGILSQLQASEDDLKAAEAVAIRDDPELAETVAKLDQARQDSEQVQARIKQIGPDITPEDSARIQEMLDCWCANMKPEEPGNWQRDPPTTPEARRANEQLLGNDWRQSAPRPNYEYYRFKQLLEDRESTPDETKKGLGRP